MNDWVIIRSWHRIRTATRVGTWLTLCGRVARANADTADILPGGKTCESCLKIYAKQKDV